MNFAEIFIKRPVATTLLVLTILIFGVMGYAGCPWPTCRPSTTRRSR